MADHADFSLAQLRYFVTSAEMGNISGAAQQLHASQSAVSMAIQRLEKQLDTKLFFRHRTKGVSLTPSGRVLLDPAKSLLAQAQEMLAHSREWQGETSGMLNVAVLRSVAPDLVPAVLSRVKEMCPGLEVTVHEGTMDDVLELLRTGTCELAVIPELPGQALSFTRLAKVLMAAVVARSDPLASVGRATLRQLATRRLLVADLDVDHQIGLDNRTRLFADAGAPTPEVALTSSIATMLGLVGVGEGFALLCRTEASQCYRQELAWIDIVSERPCASWLGAATIPGLALSSRAELFVSLLDDAVRSVYCTMADDGVSSPGSTDIFDHGASSAPDPAAPAWSTSRVSPAPARRARSASNRPRMKPASTNTRFATGEPGTPTSPCPLPPTPGCP